MTIEYEYLRFLVRGGTTANLAAVNEIPLKRELVVDMVTGKFKLGDGVTTYNALPYISGGGAAWLTGSGAPAGALGSQGDFYLRGSNGDVYEKTGPTTWTVVANIKGSPGTNGSTWFLGSGVPAGGLGVVGDLYLRSNGDYYLKTGVSTWAGISSLIGPSGPSAYDSAVLNGFVGTEAEWVASLASTIPGPPGPSSETFPTFCFGSDPGTITAGSYRDLPIPFGFVVTQWEMVCDPIGTIELDVRVTPFANHPAGSLDTICAGARPQILSGEKAQDSVLPGWTTTVPSGSVMRVIVIANILVERVTLVLKGTR